MSLSSDFNLRNSSVNIEDVADAIDQFDNWLDYTPTVTGAMTISSLIISKAKWKQYGTELGIDISFTCTISGTSSSSIIVSLPPFTGGIGIQPFACSFSQPSNTGAKLALGLSDPFESRMLIKKYDAAAWSNDTVQIRMNARLRVS